MVTITVEEATRDFTQVLKEAEAGEEVVLLRNGIPVARVTSSPGARPRRELGFAPEWAPVADILDQPLPADIRKALGA